MNAPQLRVLEEVERLSATLSEVVDRLRAAKERETIGLASEEDLTALARRTYRLHRVRDGRLAGSKLPLGDPVWDMLLELFIADKADRPLPTTSLVIAGYTAPTTGLRYVDLLVNRGLVSSETDPADRRRRMLRLTVDGRAQMEACLQAMADMERRVP